MPDLSQGCGLLPGMHDNETQSLLLEGSKTPPSAGKLQGVISMARHKRVFDLVIDFGTSQSQKSTRPLTTYSCPSRPGHQALCNNFASSLLLRTCLPMTGHRVWMPTLLPLWRKARRENSAASRLLGTTSLRFALHGWQRTSRPDFTNHSRASIYHGDNPRVSHCQWVIRAQWEL